MRPQAYVRGYIRSKLLDGPPVIIGGCERSGTSLLLAVLSAHPRVHAIGEETWAFCYSRYAGFMGDRPVRPLRLYRGLGDGPIKRGAVRWAEKSPANIFHFDAIRAHFRGRVRFIQIVRDGRDVVLSRHPRRPGRPWVSPERWKLAVRAGLNAGPDVLTIRYRDLVLDTAATIDRLCAHIGEHPTPHIYDWHRHATAKASPNQTGGVIPRLHAGSVGKYLQDGPDLDRVDALMSDPEAVELIHAYGFMEPVTTP